MLVALVTIIRTGTFEPRQMLITTLVLIWGFRLTIFLFFRALQMKGLRNFSYKQPKGTVTKKPTVKELAQGVLVQMGLMLIVLLPVIFVNSSMDSTLTALDIVGVGLWFVGFVFQAVSDLHLYLFKKKPKNQDKLLTTGLWALTRHPNYFGEICMWWGIWLMALSIRGGFYTIIGPLTITYLLLFVSGVPMVEKQYEKNKAYQKYKQRTSKFIPCFRRKGKQ